MKMVTASPVCFGTRIERRGWNIIIINWGPRMKGSCGK